MKNQKSQIVKTKIRTVITNERGQIVIPDDLRKDLGIEKGSALVLIQKGKDITMKMEKDFLRGMRE